MDTDIHIVFIHQGESWYLPYVLHQAKSNNQDRTVILLGGESDLEGIHREILAELESHRAQEFLRLYRHRSSNGESFEVFCWLRWFYLLEYMEKARVDSVWYLDSDVMLYSTIADIHQNYPIGASDCGYLILQQDFASFDWAAAAHVSYWTRSALKQFCDFVTRSFQDEEYLKLYERKWQFHVNQGVPGGICDMTTLYLFWREFPELVTNLAQSRHNTVFDLGIKTSDGYERNEYVARSGMKTIKFLNKAPMLCRTHSHDLVRAHALHFQGEGKNYIPSFYRGEKFRGKRRADIFHACQLANQVGKRSLKRFRNFAYSKFR